ncbi:unnamed protein product [Darwinula stevensoni]|uniref:Uncharacterized protein n=1 Tax=Darwinula stevensoni TaxID=69355 RepID=A0A7R9AAH3_9CRUS|nr:unnamed protein product [Darwinula stevensoni]CAG0898449.1 unnamed protein product [Darwinula stevensoni]
MFRPTEAMNGVLTEGSCSSVHAAVSAVLQDFMTHDAERHPAASCKVNGVIEIETTPGNGHIDPSFGCKKELKEAQLLLPDKAESHGQTHRNPSEEGKTESCLTDVAMPCADATQQKVDDDIALAIVAADEPTGLPEKKQRIISIGPSNEVEQAAKEKSLEKTEVQGSKEVQLTMKEKEVPKLPEQGKVDKVDRMKKRLVAAGIKVASYSILFRDCRDDDEKIAKMHDLLRKFGLRGPASLENCQKLREKTSNKMNYEEREGFNTDPSHYVLSNFIKKDTDSIDRDSKTNLVPKVSTLQPRVILYDLLRNHQMLERYRYLKLPIRLDENGDFGSQLNTDRDLTTKRDLERENLEVLQRKEKTKIRNQSYEDSTRRRHHMAGKEKELGKLDVPPSEEKTKPKNLSNEDSRRHEPLVGKELFLENFDMFNSAEKIKPKILNVEDASKRHEQQPGRDQESEKFDVLQSREKIKPKRLENEDSSKRREQMTSVKHQKPSSWVKSKTESRHSRKYKKESEKPHKEKGLGEGRKTLEKKKLEEMKGYLRTAGIRVLSYEKLFLGCRTLDQKIDRMKGLLEEKGIKAGKGAKPSSGEVKKAPRGRPPSSMTKTITPPTTRTSSASHHKDKRHAQDDKPREKDGQGQGPIEDLQAATLREEHAAKMLLLRRELDIKEEEHEIRMRILRAVLQGFTKNGHPSNAADLKLEEGRPTIKKCKELRIELELKKEMDELIGDTQHIRTAIPTESPGGERRNRRKRSTSREDTPSPVKKQKSEMEQRLSRLRCFLDSDTDSE